MSLLFGVRHPMLVIDWLVSFLVGVFFARRRAPNSWRAVMGFSVLGMALPGSVLAMGHPEWHAHYLFAAPVSGLGLAVVGSVGIVTACAFGHRVGSVAPRVRPLAAVSVSLCMWWSAERALSWGGREAYLNGTATALPASFVGWVALLSLWTGGVFVTAIRASAPPPATSSTRRPRPPALRGTGPSP